MDIYKYVYACILYGTRTFIYEAMEFAKVVEDKKDGGGGKEKDVCMSWVPELIQIL